MPYIGNTIRAADDYRLIDDISSSFNGSTTSFALQVAGSAPVPFPKSPQQVLISVNGVIQEPDPTGSSGFNLVGTNIVFSSAPTNGHAFFGIIYATADYLNAGGNFPSGSLGAPSITFIGDENSGLYRKSGGSVGFVSDATEIANFDSNGITISSGNLIIPDSITHNGDTNTKIRFPSDDNVTIETGGVEGFRVYSNSIVQTTQANSAIGAIIKNTTHDSQLQILASASNKNSVIFFGDAADDDIGQIDYDHNDNSLSFVTNTTKCLFLDSSGNLKPGSDSNFDIGSSSNRFANGYFDTLYGDGSNLTGISAGTALTGSTNNTITTVTGANAIQGEANLTFDGATLNIDGGSNDTPLILDTSATAGSHLRFRKDGSNKHFFGCGGGFGLGDVDDLSLRTVDNIIFGVDTSEKMRMDANGRLLIGQTSSITGLQVGSPNLQVTKSGADVAMFRRNSNDAGGPFITMVKDRNGAIVADDDLVGAIAFLAHDGTDLDSYAAQIRVTIDGTPGANVTPGRMSFQTSATSANRTTERMVIDPVGRVGIGSANPVGSNALFGGTQNTLLVAGSAAPMVRIASDTANQADLILQAGNSGADAHIANAASNGDIVFSTHNGSSQGTRVRILDDGGICFNSDTAAANALDDYEEGTWSPSGSWTTITASYTKIGRLVNAGFSLRADASSGNVTIGNLPFTSGDTHGHVGGIAWGLCEFNTTDSWLNGSVDDDSTTVTVRRGNATVVTFGSGNNNMNQNAFIRGMIVYMTD